MSSMKRHMFNTISFPLYIFFINHASIMKLFIIFVSQLFNLQSILCIMNISVSRFYELRELVGEQAPPPCCGAASPLTTLL